MKKKTKIIIVVAVILVVISVIMALTIYSFTPVSKDSEEVIITINSGDSKFDIIDNLKKSNLIKSKISSYAYILLKGNANIQAGSYKLDRNMSLAKILNIITSGDVYVEVFKITFVEGKRLDAYAKQIADKLDISKEEVISVLNDKTYLKELIEEYWFLTDEILNPDIYYPLEGYLFPATYEFYSNSTVKDIIEKMLDTTAKRLEGLKSTIENSKYSVHEALAYASIIELEGASTSDREKISQVISKRLDISMSLGMDVTTYYGVKKNIGEGLTYADLNAANGYNTSSRTGKKGLPVGPICNPSLDSIKAVFNPADTDHLYFFADLKTGIIYFTNTYQEHLNIQKEIGGN